MSEHLSSPEWGFADECLQWRNGPQCDSSWRTFGAGFARPQNYLERVDLLTRGSTISFASTPPTLHKCLIAGRHTHNMAAPVVNGNAGTKVQQNLRPNQSLYIQNLSVKEKKEDLLRLLYITFASEAQVIDVTVLKSEKMRGQAHILLKDVQSATYAMEKLQSTMFLDRPLVRCLKLRELGSTY